MSSPVHHSKDIDPSLIYAPPWAREQALRAQVAVPFVAAPSHVAACFESCALEEDDEDFAAPDPGDNPAYYVAIECAALCMIAINSGGNSVFRSNLREALREALYLRGGLHETRSLVDDEVRNVLSDVVARTTSLSQLLDAVPDCDAEMGIVL
jgi:hypothetical protein